MTDRDHKLRRALPAALPSAPPPPAIRAGALTRAPRFRHLPALLLLLAVAVLLLFQSAPAQAQTQPGITLSSTGVGVIAGSTEVYEVKLNTQPTASVTITPSSGTTGVATVSGALTFTTTNWNDAQEVTITGVTAGTSTITHASASSDTNYSGITLPSVTATVLAPSTLVSNTGQDVDADSLASLQGINGISNAFTTGSNSDGYAVTSVDVRFNVTGNSPLGATNLAAVSAALHNASGDNPGTKITDLTRPTSISGGASVVTFTAPAGTHLAASTTYHVVIDGVPNTIARIKVQRTDSDDEDAGAAAGWTIANAARTSAVSSWGSFSPAAAIMFAVKGGARQKMTAQPPTTLTLTTNAASNTIAEDGGNVTVTATLNRAATTAVSVTLTATGTATGTADYSLPSAFTIPIGSTSATGTVSIVDDDIDEENETVILSTTVSGLTVAPVTLTITDDDTAGGDGQPDRALGPSGLDDDLHGGAGLQAHGQRRGGGDQRHDGQRHGGAGLAHVHGDQLEHGADLHGHGRGLGLIHDHPRRDEHGHEVSEQPLHRLRDGDGFAGRAHDAVRRRG